MTNAERLTHVIRILGTNKKGDILPDFWADVERIDMMDIKTQVIQPGGVVSQYQLVTIRLRWLDDPDGSDYDSSAAKNRSHKTVKVCDPSLPQEQLDDPDEFIAIRCIQHMEIKHAGGSIMKHFRDNDPNSNIDSRVIDTRRITHWDTTIDEAAQKAFDADPTRKVYVVQGRDYERVEETEDEDQYVEHQIVKKLNRQDSQQLLSTGLDQRRVLYLRNQYLIDESREAKLQESGKDEVDPPYRLDPFQNIINVQWSALKQVVIGAPHPGYGSPTATFSTKDGQEFSENFGANTFSGASGLGKTVISNGYNLVAFGKPRDGASCFIVVDGNWVAGTDNRIRRGALNDEGELEWTTIDTFPSSDGNDDIVSAFSCCFAGKAFFIQYLSGGNKVHMAVSFDGETFTKGINPFPGVHLPSVYDPDDTGGGPDPIGGSVAYDKKTKRYVTTGSYSYWYASQYVIHGFEDIYVDTFDIDQNFMSSVSSNGLNWTPKFDQSKGRGFGASTNPITDIAALSTGPSTVCFSDTLGLFIAPTIYKKIDQNLDNSDVSDSLDYPWYIEASAVATSTDGVNWTNKVIGSTGYIRYGYGSQYSFSNCVTFVKTGNVDPATGSDGFFLLGTNGGTNNIDGDPPARSRNEIWKSVDGVTWTSTRRSDVGFPLAMTQINKNFDPAKVVYI